METLKLVSDSAVLGIAGVRLGLYFLYGSQALSSLSLANMVTCPLGVAIG